MKPLNVGVVGLKHGLSHARIVQELLKQAEVVMLCDLNADRLKKAAEELEIAKTTTHFADLIADEDIDIICIASPDYSHGNMTLAALEAGKHLMVEVPLETRDLDLLWKIVRLAERRNLKVQMDLPDRWLPESVTMKKLISDGDIGDPYYVITEYLQDIRQQGGGVGLSVNNFRMGRGEMPQEPVSAGAATYAVDTAMWFCGEPFTEVFAYGNRKNLPMRNIDDHDVALFRTKSGTIARVQCSKAARRPYKEIIKSVWGTKGTVECTGYLPAPDDGTTVYACVTGVGAVAEPYEEKYEMKPVPLEEVLPPKGLEHMTDEQKERVGHGAVEVHSWVDLIDSIENDRLPTINVYQAFRVCASQIAVRKSKEENRPILIPQIVERHEELKPLRPLPFADVPSADYW